jgi:hypothetical protein
VFCSHLRSQADSRTRTLEGDHYGTCGIAYFSGLLAPRFTLLLLLLLKLRSLSVNNSISQISHSKSVTSKRFSKISPTSRPQMLDQHRLSKSALNQDVKYLEDKFLKIKPMQCSSSSSSSSELLIYYHHHHHYHHHHYHHHQGQLKSEILRYEDRANSIPHTALHKRALRHGLHTKNGT